MNNFQKLQEENEEQYYTEHGSDLRDNLLGTFSTYRFIGDIIDVYVPRVVDLFIAIAGGGESDSPKSTSIKGKRDPASGATSEPKGKGPGE